ncbi:SDR family oxidoreductase [Nocardia sp. NEAU-G5]|uniref:SDR family oxidoreductase n=1 Tax=Nocardia albiluteola TaxID=2842303 RepID=A0ABS6AZU5_9NOCA|nr:SDR family oxidoreductase [Nocardia albiluteola]MBU3063575.1 SDR family oxidoreductase [Nocardia albiluteola]
MTIGVQMILVTGANGRPGSAVIREFARRGEPVRALVRTPSNGVDLSQYPTVEVVHGDMLWPHTMTGVFDGVDRVLMISGAGPDLLETQVTFIDAAKNAGVSHIVKFSGRDATRGMDPNAMRSTRSHEQILRYLAGSGVAWTVLRPSQFMQVFFEEIPDILESGQIRLPLGAATLAPVDIEDIAKVAHATLTTSGHEGHTYHLTGPDALTVEEIADRISRAVGKPVTYVDVAPEQKLREWLDAGYPPARANAFLQLFNQRRELGVAEVYLGTHTKFGIEPTTFGQFALRHAAEFSGAAPYAVTPA